MGRATVSGTELKTYDKQRSHLLEHHAWKFVLIHDSDVVGIFESDLEAINHGHERVGNVPFLGRRIVEVDTPLQMISHPIGG